MMAKREEALTLELEGNGIVSDRLQMKKHISNHGFNRHRSVYSKGRECSGSEKTALNNVK